MLLVIGRCGISYSSDYFPSLEPRNNKAQLLNTPVKFASSRHIKVNELTSNELWLQIFKSPWGEGGVKTLFLFPFGHAVFEKHLATNCTSPRWVQMLDIAKCTCFQTYVRPCTTAWLTLFFRRFTQTRGMLTTSSSRSIFSSSWRTTRRYMSAKVASFLATASKRVRFTSDACTTEIKQPVAVPKKWSIGPSTLDEVTTCGTADGKCSWDLPGLPSLVQIVQWSRPWPSTPSPILWRTLTSSSSSSTALEVLNSRMSKNTHIRTKTLAWARITYYQM